MIEVYSGTRPGRPGRLTLVSAATLCLMLALAWTQVRSTRALGDEVRLPGTPLVVRPPRNWVHDPDSPGRFLPRTRLIGADRGEDPLEHRIAVGYERRPTFTPLADLIRLYDWQDVAASDRVPPTATTIGGFPGVQAIRARTFRYRGRMYVHQTVLRVVSLPRGDVVRVEYWPLGELSEGDFELLDGVCQAIRLEDPAYQQPPEALLTQAGVRFEIPPGWRLCGPDFEPVAGLYLQDTGTGFPRWALGVFRTWLAPNRSPRDLLTDFAEQVWLLARASVEVHEYTRIDGVRVATLRHPEFGGPVTMYPAVRLVASSPEEAVLLVAISDGAEAREADRAAEDLAGRINVVAGGRMPSISDAVRSGRELVASVTERGAKPWWGTEPQRGFLLGRYGDSPLGEVRVRHWVARGGEPGYHGRGLVRLGTLREWDEDLDSLEEDSWIMEPGGIGYAYRSSARYVLGRDRQVRFEVQEQRPAGSAFVTRTVRRNTRESTTRFRVGPGFVCPPLESVIEAAASQRGEGAWLVELSDRHGSDTHTQLYRSLPPDERGRARLLRQVDYWPVGSVISCDALANPYYTLMPGGKLEAVSPAVAARVAPFLLRFAESD
jgi:hypothetical protein